MLAAVVLAAPVLSAQTPQGSLLLDLGNGQIYWLDTDAGTLGEALSALSAAYGVGTETEGGRLVSAGGVRECVIGGGETAVRSSWKFYRWDGTWTVSDYDLSDGLDGTAAFGFYPDAPAGRTIRPTSVPDSRTVWTRYQGSSEARSVSDSYGPKTPALPVEWSRTYSTGFVNSGILVAGDLLYHTTGGNFHTSGDPWLYCLDRHTGAEVWKFRYAKGDGYEITTPVLLDDLLIFGATNHTMYCLDRFDGSKIWEFEVPYDPPRDPETGIIPFSGRLMGTAFTTPVYDSGAMYFGSADGRVYCYSVTRDGYHKVWETAPAVGMGRGCFYFHAPAVTTVATESGPERTVFIGNYEGYVFALKASTGEPLWDTLGKQVIDLSAPGVNTAEPGKPGSAGSITVAGSMLLVSCTDSAMTSMEGYTLALDAATGTELWRIHALLSSPVVLGDCFFAYVSPAARAKGPTITYTDGRTEEAGYAVYRFDHDGKAVWRSREYQWIKAPLTYADGVLYGMDYSTGYFYPTGGCLTAVDAGNGQELWRLLLRPFSMDSFSMGQPTVVDGRIYVGNDYGAVYCLSDIPGPDPEGTGFSVLETPGFRHWSWYTVTGVFGLLMMAFVRFY